uniref:NADH-ubiquinone oxidoreductase chain 2 n=1 Tax=Scolytus seulensis TaxID=1230772 RepID=A0A6G6C8T1_9CUCU|nr:NADH dehydrogenase subunit 2 [Scolytus seulensis]QID77572.1 NADH dehydrogenase subunit 2 [Scolytus seulensis]
MYLHKMSFSILLISGTLMTISASSWFSAWVGLEVNLLSFIPLIKNKTSKLSSESMMKYFITQALGSMIVMFSIISSYITPNMVTLMTLGLLLKLGAAPLHSWFPEVAAGLSWSSMFILMTWQKIAPMVMIMYSTNNQYIMTVFIITSSLMGGLMGMNQTNLRKIMAYSSINHMGWMLAALINSWMIWLYYFSVYTVINATISYTFNSYKMSSVNQMNKLQYLEKLFMTMNFLSLGGLPPFLGFLPKWFTIMSLTNNQVLFLTIPLIVLTLMCLFYYLRMTLTHMVLITEKSTMMNKYKMSFSLLMLNNISLATLLVAPILMNIF